MTGMRARDIYAELYRNESSSHKIAAKVGLCQQTVWNVIHGRSRNPKVQALVAETIGMTVEEVFGLRMDQSPSESIR